MHINTDTDVPLHATLQRTNNKVALALSDVIFYSQAVNWHRKTLHFPTPFTVLYCGY
jgi:hypothetical protein